MYGSELESFRSQGTDADLLVAERTSQPPRPGATLAAESYQHQSEIETKSLVWQRVFSPRSPAPGGQPSRSPRAAGAPQILHSSSGTNLLGLLDPHFFDAGEERGGFEAEEFGGPACAIDFPVGGL